MYIDLILRMANGNFKRFTGTLRLFRAEVNIQSQVVLKQSILEEILLIGLWERYALNVA